MPKRSNTYQRLIAAVHADLGPGWDVKESVFLTDSVTGKEREVDIVAKSNIGNYIVIISIECRDHGRPADVTWVEAMAKKHEHLPTSKLVLWSRSGFSRNAIVKATVLKIDAIFEGNAAQVDWAKLAQSLVDSRLKYVTPRFNAFVDVETDDGSRRRYEPCESLLFGDVGAASGIAISGLLAEIYAMPELRTVLLDHASEGKGDYYIEWKTSTPLYVWDRNKRLGKLLRVGIGLQTMTEMSPVEVCSVLRNGVVHTLATANISAGGFEVHIKEGPDLPPSVGGAKIVTKNNLDNKASARGRGKRQPRR